MGRGNSLHFLLNFAVNLRLLYKIKFIQCFKSMMRNFAIPKSRRMHSEESCVCLYSLPPEQKHS